MLGILLTGGTRMAVGLGGGQVESGDWEGGMRPRPLLLGTCPIAPAPQVTVAFGRRGVTKLVDVLKSEVTTPAEKTDALALLIGEVSTQERKSEAIRGSSVEAAVALLSSSDVRVRTNAGVLLARLVLLQQGRAAVSACGGVHALTFNCGDAEPGPRAAACAALASLAFFRDGCDIVVSTADAVDSLVRTLARHPGAVTVLVNITAYYAEGSRQALAAGVVHHLVAILTNSANTAVVHEQACLTLRHLAVHDAGACCAVHDPAPTGPCCPLWSILSFAPPCKARRCATYVSTPAPTLHIQAKSMLLQMARFQPW